MLQKGWGPSLKRSRALLSYLQLITSCADLDYRLIFPRWDIVAIILSVFLMTYTYIEAKSNYHRGSILILSYLVLVSGFYYAPNRSDEDEFMAGYFQPIAQSLGSFFSLH